MIRAFAWSVTFKIHSIKIFDLIRLNSYLTHFSNVSWNQGTEKKDIQENHAWISFGTYTYIEMLYRNTQRLYNAILMFQNDTKEKKWFKAFAWILVSDKIRF